MCRGGVCVCLYVCALCREGNPQGSEVELTRSKILVSDGMGWESSFLPVASAANRSRSDLLKTEAESLILPQSWYF